MHSDHGCLFFFHVKELDEAIFERIIEVHPVFALHLLDVLSAKDEAPLLVNNEERALDSSCVSVEPDLLVGDITDDRDLLRNLVVSAEVHYTFDEVVSVVVSSPPVSVDKNLDEFSSEDRLSDF